VCLIAAVTPSSGRPRSSQMILPAQRGQQKAVSSCQKGKKLAGKTKTSASPMDWHPSRHWRAQTRAASSSSWLVARAHNKHTLPNNKLAQTRAPQTRERPHSSWRLICAELPAPSRRPKCLARNQSIFIKDPPTIRSHTRTRPHRLALAGPSLWPPARLDARGPARLPLYHFFPPFSLFRPPFSRPLSASVQPVFVNFRPLRRKDMAKIWLVCIGLARGETLTRSRTAPKWPKEARKGAERSPLLIRRAKKTIRARPFDCWQDFGETLSLAARAPSRGRSLSARLSLAKMRQELAPRTGPRTGSRTPAGPFN